MPDEENPAESDEEKTSFLKKLPLQNYWMIATIVLAILLIIVLISGGITGGTIGVNQAGQKILDFANSVGVNDAEIININDMGNFYGVNISTSDGDGQVFITKDGKYLIQPISDLSSKQTNTNTQTPQQTSYSEAELIELRAFNKCLADNGLVIYGSNTCPHCRNLVTLLGGYDVASSIYVECSQERERCNNEAKTGYIPEIQLNGEIFEDARTLESFAQETGCPVPELSGITTTNTGGGS